MAKDVQIMMKNPKISHSGDEINRRKIWYFIDKYVTRLYGSRHNRSLVTIETDCSQQVQNRLRTAGSEQTQKL
jgi:hypothetical protein